MINNPYLVGYLIQRGADTSLKAEPLSFMVESPMTPMEYAISIEKTGVNLSLAKQALAPNG